MKRLTKTEREQGYFIRNKWIYRKSRIENIIFIDLESDKKLDPIDIDNLLCSYFNKTPNPKYFMDIYESNIIPNIPIMSWYDSFKGAVYFIPDRTQWDIDHIKAYIINRYLSDKSNYSNKILFDILTYIESKYKIEIEFFNQPIKPINE